MGMQLCSEYRCMFSSKSGPAMFFGAVPNGVHIHDYSYAISRKLPLIFVDKRSNKFLNDNNVHEEDNQIYGRIFIRGNICLFFNYILVPNKKLFIQVHNYIKSRLLRTNHPLSGGG